MRISLSILAPPGERTGHVDGSPTRECQVLLPRSIVPSAAVREGCCAARSRANQAEQVNHAIELSSSTRDLFRYDCSEFYVNTDDRLLYSARKILARHLLRNFCYR